MHLHIISRETARRLNLSRFFTGKPCKRGQVSERLACNSHCQCEPCKEARRDSNARHRQNNLEAVRDRCRNNQRTYRQSNHETVLASRRRYYRENQTLEQERRRSYYANNRSAELDRSRRYVLATREAYRERKRRYRELNPHIGRTSCARRRAAERERLPTWFGEFDEFVMVEAASLADQREDATGIEWHVDHMVPLQARKASGLHCGHNLQVIPGGINLRKGNKLWLDLPDEWLAMLA